jgi:hypothetical protein
MTIDRITLKELVEKGSDACTRQRCQVAFNTLAAAALSPSCASAIA